MDNPTVVPRVTIKLGGEERSLRLGFRALKELGVNPFKPDSIKEFVDGMDVDRAGKIVRACLLHEYAKGEPRHGQEPPSADDVLDMLDLALFQGTLASLFASSGLLGDGGDASPGDATADPPTA